MDTFESQGAGGEKPSSLRLDKAQEDIYSQSLSFVPRSFHHWRCITSVRYCTCIWGSSVMSWGPRLSYPLKSWRDSSRVHRSLRATKLFSGQSCDLPRHRGRPATCNGWVSVRADSYGTVIGLRAFPLAQAYSRSGRSLRLRFRVARAQGFVWREQLPVPHDHDTGYASARAEQAGRQNNYVCLSLFYGEIR